MALEQDRHAVAVMADIVNQPWPMPTRAWKLYLRLVHGVTDGNWQGRVIGPLLRFGFNPVPKKTTPCEWIATCNSLVQKKAFLKVGGFSNFFLHRSTMNEDVDLGMRLNRIGRLLYCPRAKLGHFHDPAGRVSPRRSAEDDLFNRFHVLVRRRTASRAQAMALVATFFLIETLSNVAGSIRRLQWGPTGTLAVGRLSGLWKIIRQAEIG